ncbi:MAG: TIGR00730 family Rossman fold protein [Armatimonadota bacterium]
MLKNVCVFCGSSSGSRPEYREAAREVGRALARRGIGLVYGGGNIGLMGEVAEAALQAGGRVTGVIPQALLAREVGHRGLTELVVVHSMHERKALMAERSDAFLALPGGFGTFEEFCEAITWTQLGVHRKPCGLLNVAGFYDPLLALFDHAVSEGFLHPQHREIVLVRNEIEPLLDAFAGYIPQDVEKWLDRDET